MSLQSQTPPHTNAHRPNTPPPFPLTSSSSSSFHRAYILYTTYHTMSSGGTISDIWNKIELPLKIAQTAAIVEVLHSAVGLVRSPVFITAIQVASRLWILWGILDLAPAPRSQSLVLLSLPHLPRIAISLVTLMLAWCTTEIVRYAFFALKEMGLEPYYIKWLRYTLFIVLYPLGVASELGAVVLANAYLRKTGMWSWSMPNEFNFAFDYWLICWVAVFLYLPGFPVLYGYMLSQRRKVLGTSRKTKLS